MSNKLINLTSFSTAYNPLQDPEYMSDAMKNYFKNLLRESKKRIMDKNSEVLTVLSERNDQERDPLDKGLLEETKYQSIYFHDRMDRMLHDIQLALDKIETNHYGYCDETDEAIGVKRLMAAPYVRYCIEAQAMKEKRMSQRLFHRVS